jgi:hypothetical protein
VDSIEGASREARQLLEAEAERRGISVKDLVDQLARESRRTGITDIDPQGNLSRWAVIPQRATDVEAQGAVTFGAMSSGKTNAADLTRAQLEAHGVPFRERFDEANHVEFSFERPEDGRE